MTREEELEVAISNALSALGLGSCPEPNCVGCQAEREAALVSLLATGIKPAGWEYYAESAKLEWEALIEWVNTEYKG